MHGWDEIVVPFAGPEGQRVDRVIFARPARLDGAIDHEIGKRGEADRRVVLQQRPGGREAADGELEVVRIEQELPLQRDIHGEVEEGGGEVRDGEIRRSESGQRVGAGREAGGIERKGTAAAIGHRIDDVHAVRGRRGEFHRARAPVERINIEGAGDRQRAARSATAPLPSALAFCVRSVSLLIVVPPL